MTSYFEKFPKTYYKIGSNYKLAVDITRRVGFTERVKTNENGYISYVVQDGERAEDIAHKFYGSAELHWVILLMNDMINPYFDWALSSRELEDYIQKKYSNRADEIAEGRLEDSGIIIDLADEFLLSDGEPLLLTGGDLEGETVLVVVAPAEYDENILLFTNRQLEIEKNEKKKRIKLLRPEYIQTAIQELEDKIQ